MQYLHVNCRDQNLNFIEHNCYESRGKSVSRLIRSACKDMILPDFNFLVNTGDHPGNIGPYSAFSFSTTTEDFSKVAPDFLFDSWPEVQIDDYEDLCEKLSSAGKTLYERGCIGWIGVPMVEVRKNLISLSRLYPSIIDAIDIQWNRADPNKLTSHKFMTLEQQVRKWKYLIDVEGCGWSARFKTFLWSRRIIFMVDRPWKEWYYPSLKPWTHYIPVQRDLSDLIKNYEIIERDENLQHHIISNSIKFANNNLCRKAAINRWRNLIFSNCN